MMSLSLSLSYPIHRFASYNKQLCALRSPQSHHTRISQHKLQQSSSFLGYNPLRFVVWLIWIYEPHFKFGLSKSHFCTCFGAYFPNFFILSSWGFDCFFYRVSIDVSGEMNMKRRGGVVCSAAALTPRNLQWVCTISSV